MTFLLALKALLISVLTALAGAWIPTLLKVGPPYAWGLMWFTLPGALILSNVYAVIRVGRHSAWINYLGVMLAGTVVGALMLSWLGIAGIAMGAAYGAFTSLCWIALHLIARPWRIGPAENYGAFNA